MIDPKKSNWKIDHVVERCQCSRAVAIAHLDAEEWDVANAVISLRGDLQSYRFNLAPTNDEPGA